MKRALILGSTGSIGQSALAVARAVPGQLRVVGLAARADVEGVALQAAEFGVRHLALADAAAARALGTRLGTPVHAGPDGICELVTACRPDIVLCALVGIAGLRPVLTALDAGIPVALATKEVLVAAGELVMGLARARGVAVLPVDSEHSALFQCLKGSAETGELPGLAPVRRLILTASGGPFAHSPELDLAQVTVAQALAHPRWSMGRKVTIDSATMMNKGLEILEARWLFDVPADRIDVVIHPESIVHSFVEFVDGSLLAQMSPPDMRYAIQYALLYPARHAGGLAGLDLAAMGALHFSAPDPLRFPSLRLVREASAAGGTMPAVLNAANEVAVAAFLEQGIRFPGIWQTTEAVMQAHSARPAAGLDDILDADEWARAEARRFLRRHERVGT